MQLNMRTARRENDYWRVREFLREVFLLNSRRELSWQVYRFDYWRWHGFENLGHSRMEGDAFLRETNAGRIAAVLNPEGRGQTFLQVHLGLRTPGLEAEMLAIAEKHLARPGPNGRRKLWVWTDEHDGVRQDIPTRRSRRDTRCAHWEVLRNFLRVVSYRGKHSIPMSPQISTRGGSGIEISSAPLYRRDLDIEAVAPGGEFASFCTVWFDDVTRTGAFEPVGTAPAHQQHVAGKAVMCEGLRRLEQMGATMAYVGSHSPAAHALYASVGFTDYELSEPWAKEM